MERVKLTDLCKPKQWKTIAKKDLQETGYPVYGANGIIGYSNTYNHEKETVVIACRGTCGEVHLSQPKSYINGNAMSLDDLDTKRICVKYLYYALKSYDFTKIISGTSQPQITKQGLEKVNLSICPLSEQYKIVEVLTRVNNLLSFRQQQLQLLDDLVKSQFIEMFGDCKLNPKGWDTVKLGEISDVRSSKRVFVEELKDEGIPFYRGTEIGELAKGNSIAPELYITFSHYSELIAATGKPTIGDLLMPSICPDGRIWMVNTEDPFYFKDGRVLWVHLISQQFNPVFLLYCLKDRIINDYSSIASGTTFAELKIFALKECRIFCVPLYIQQEFVAYINQIDKSKFTIQKSIKELETLQKTLMQIYFG